MVTVLLALVVGFNVWGVATQGSLEPALSAERDTSANRVVMVFGASGSAGGGLLKAAVEDNEVEKVPPNLLKGRGVQVKNCQRYLRELKQWRVQEIRCP